jgi:ComF family protein
MMFQDLVRLLFPETCYACNKAMVHGEKFICTTCNVKLPYTNYHVHGATAANPLQHRFWGKVPVRYVFSYLHFKPKGRVQRLLHQLKYKGASHLGNHLGKRYGAILKEYQLHEQFDIIMPVPLHWQKQQQRGYNQSDSFAEGLARAMKLQLQLKGLKRTINTASQTNKSRLDRWQNVEQVFKVQQPATLKGKRILLVDDVMTTGATLEACTRVLLANGCKEVSVVTIAAA